MSQVDALADEAIRVVCVELDRGVEGERGVEFLDIASDAALLHDGAPAIEDGHERQTAEGDESTPTFAGTADPSGYVT